jgi:formylglycine-generating enzyme required for sulfatase activity
LGKHEVTQAQWERVMGSNPSNFKGADRPVERVSWTEAVAFCKKLTEMEKKAGRVPEGMAYQLPTEAQWEYACRAGTPRTGTPTAYSWGDSISAKNASYDRDLDDGTTPVGKYPANPWGFHDMHGNVFEWCADWYGTYLAGPVTDPPGAASGAYRVLRGGSWNSGGAALRSAVRLNGTIVRSALRNYLTPSRRYDSLGFRVGFRAKEAVQEEAPFAIKPPVQFKLKPRFSPPVKFTIPDLNLTREDAQREELRIRDTKAAYAKLGDRFTVPDLNLTMLWVEPGKFMMGRPVRHAERRKDERQHQVTLTKGFYLGKYEVTQAQWEKAMGSNPSNFKGADRPVERVSWTEAVEFCKKLTEVEKKAGRVPEGMAYQLPTEAQWEYACRAGTTTAYSWGATITKTNANYNWDGGANDGSDFKQTRDVGQYAANPWGFFDMHGNVNEWVGDWKANFFWGGSARVLRGGSWSGDGADLRSAERYGNSPSRRNYTLGFRVGFRAREAVQEEALQEEAPKEASFAVKPGENFTVPDLNLTREDAQREELRIRDTKAAYAKLGDRFTVPDLNLTMIWVEPGTFMMGSPESEEGHRGNETQHQVTLTKGFYLGKHEVTQAQWEKVMGSNPSSSKGADRPVVKVSWNDAVEFCKKLTEMEKKAGRVPQGMAYQLPTEAQWEYACRAGTTTAYSWGDSISSKNASHIGGGTTPVGKYPANPWGFHDMHGNVREWCADWYDDYPSGAVTDPLGPASGSYRVRRGGSWGSGGAALRSAGRHSYPPSTRANNLGFRVGFQASK